MRPFWSGLGKKIPALSADFVTFLLPSREPRNLSLASPSANACLSVCLSEGARSLFQHDRADAE